jgi:hypothetical protein
MSFHVRLTRTGSDERQLNGQLWPRAIATFRQTSHKAFEAILMLDRADPRAGALVAGSARCERLEQNWPDSGLVVVASRSQTTLRVRLIDLRWQRACLVTMA